MSLYTTKAVFNGEVLETVKALFLDIANEEINAEGVDFLSYGTRREIRGIHDEGKAAIHIHLEGRIAPNVINDKLLMKILNGLSMEFEGNLAEYEYDYKTLKTYCLVENGLMDFEISFFLLPVEGDIFDEVVFDKPYYVIKY